MDLFMYCDTDLGQVVVMICGNYQLMEIFGSKVCTVLPHHRMTLKPESAENVPGLQYLKHRSGKDFRQICNSAASVAERGGGAAGDRAVSTRSAVA